MISEIGDEFALSVGLEADRPAPADGLLYLAKDTKTTWVCYNEADGWQVMSPLFVDESGNIRLNGRLLLFGSQSIANTSLSLIFDISESGEAKLDVVLNLKTANLLNSNCDMGMRLLSPFSDKTKINPTTGEGIIMWFGRKCNQSGPLFLNTERYPILEPGVYYVYSYSSYVNYAELIPDNLTIGKNLPVAINGATSYLPLSDFQNWHPTFPYKKQEYPYEAIE